jgi:hypothetical protein
MPSHRKARQLATKFDKEYPPTLSARLAWWCRVLGIDRPRFLRMMGMSADEATRERDTSWSDLLKKKDWQENAWWVEGKLHDLLALFDYDWTSLPRGTAAGGWLRLNCSSQNLSETLRRRSDAWVAMAGTGTHSV